MKTSEMDARPGGKYRWVWDVDGADLVIHGDIFDADKPHRMVTREFMEMEGIIPPGAGYTLNLIIFTEEEGRTTAAVHIACASKEARDAMLASGMQGGMDEGYTRLVALLKEL